MPNYHLKTHTCQWRFQESRNKVQIFAGAFGNGKSTGLCVKALRLATQYPGSTGLMARETYPKLNGTLRKTLLQWCPPGWIDRLPTKDENSLYLNNKSVIDFRYVAQRGKNQEDGTTTSNLLSAAYDWIVLDQIEDPLIQYKDFLDLIGRCRGETRYRPLEDDEDPTMPSTGPRFFMIGCNPTRNWFFKKVVQPIQLFKEHGIRTDDLIVDPETQLPLVDLFESDIYENADNLAKDYITLMEASYKGQMRDRYILGKWTAFEGLIYPDFQTGRNTLPREVALAHLRDCLKRHVKVKVLEGYDFGLTSPSCYLLAFVDDYGRVIILDGFYEPNYSYTKHKARVEEIRSNYEHLLKFNEPIWADPDVFRKKVISGVSVTHTTIAQLVGLPMRAGANDIIPGIAKVGSYVTGRDDIPFINVHDATVGEEHLKELEERLGGPLLYAVDDLMFIQDEFNGYYWKKNPQGKEIDEPQEGNDHAMDTIKYMLSRLPDASAIVLPIDKRPKGYMLWREVEKDRYGRIVA